MQPNQLHFKTFRSFAIVGTNTTSRSNGIIDPNYHGIVVIPKTFNELPILEIGTYAFSDCIFITHVIIEANLISINNFAFERTTNLTSINIPRSVEYIGNCAFSSYNLLNHTTNEKVYNSLGTLVVSFESNSNLQKISNTPFGRKEHVILKFKNKLSPSFSCSQGWYYSTGSFTILSEEEFTSCNIEATVIPFVDITHDIESVKKILKTIKKCTSLKRFFSFTIYRQLFIISLI